jgi:hypothetical protein
VTDYLDPKTGERRKPDERQPPDWHTHQARPTGEPDAEGWTPYEVYSRAHGVIARGRCRP